METINASPDEVVELLKRCEAVLSVSKGSTAHLEALRVALLADVRAVFAPVPDAVYDAGREA